MDHAPGPELRLQPGQLTLTPAQEAEAKRFAAERIAAQLSTEPADEPAAEALLAHAYAAAHLSPPTRIHWVNGPLQLVATLVDPDFEASAGNSVWPSVYQSVRDSIRERLYESVRESVREHVEEGRYQSAAWSAGKSPEQIVEIVWASMRSSVRKSVEESVGRLVEAGVGRLVWQSVWDQAGRRVWRAVWEATGDSVEESVDASRRAYEAAPTLAFYRFFDRYLAPNELRALARFNEMASGYWLGSEETVIVRRPRVLARDAEGRLHSATGKCIEYRDGWGFYAWHGAPVPDKVILAPERLTREDFLSAPNADVRRVIQERMGARLVRESGDLC